MDDYKYIEFNSDGTIKTFYSKDANENIPENTIKITNELWLQILSTSNKKLVKKSNIDVNNVYKKLLDLFDMSDIDKDTTIYPPSLEDRVSAIEQYLLNL